MTASSQQPLIAAMTANQAVSIITDGGAGYNLVGGHAYMVIGYNSANGTFQLANPWGYDDPVALTWNQLCANCVAFSSANASGTVPIGGPAGKSQVASLSSAAATDRGLALIDWYSALEANVSDRDVALSPTAVDRLALTW